MLGFRWEPALLSEAVRQVMLALVLFNILNWNEQQTAAFMMVVSALLALFTRSVSVPVATVEEAGHSATELKNKADSNIANRNNGK